MLQSIDPNALSLIGAAFAFGYLLGSIPFGLILTRFAGSGDIRNIGSGNIGATNVLRTGRKGLAAATLLCDALKGTAAVLAATQIFGAKGAAIAGFGAFCGHLFPVWLRFRGGKGVATYIGVLVALAWPAALVLCAVWLIVALITRYSSLASLLASLAPPAMLWAMHDPHLAILTGLMSALVFFMHRANIARLLSGTESRIGQSSAAP